MQPRRHHTLTTGERPLTWAEVVRGLQEDAALRDQLTALVASSPHDAVFWECVPVSAATRGRRFECVLPGAPALAGTAPDPSAFAEHLEGEDRVAVFDNLGGDALLVAPTRHTAPEASPHLAAFVRDAPREQVHALWATVGREVARWWSRSDRPLWVSTSGLGVPWLHVRLDRRPKYVTYRPFRRFEG